MFDPSDFDSNRRRRVHFSEGSDYRTISDSGSAEQADFDNPRDHNGSSVEPADFDNLRHNASRLAEDQVYDFLTTKRLSYI